MTRRPHPLTVIAAAVAFLGLPLRLPAQVGDSARVTAAADRIIDQSVLSPAASPGCVVGISLGNRTIYERAFGFADLEFDIPLTPESISESGSVAKQFSAAAVVLLALDGRLDLDDPVRKYLPELPDYGKPLTIRHLLNHTGGVRDWGSVLGLTGVGRGDRVVTQALAMNVIVHQRALDFTPGAEYSYSNSGYTLAATVVERVTGQTLAEFTTERLFRPLGMTHTSWRDDYQRVVKGRAQAYSRQGTGPWRLEMPIMSVYGNGGMLTTVGDWLKWNAMLASRSLGAALVDSLETPGRLSGGRTSSYALGLVVDRYKGHRQIAHNGATAAYATSLARYPDLDLSIAVLCNTPSINPTLLTHRIVDEVVAPLVSPPPPPTESLTAAELRRHVGLWREEETHLPIRIALEGDSLRISGRGTLRPLRDGSLQVGQGVSRWTLLPRVAGQPARASLTVGDNTEYYLAQPDWKPTVAALRELAGVWYSDEADATFTLVVERGEAALVQREGQRLALRPLYRDHFTLADPISGPSSSSWRSSAVVWFTRESGGRTTMHFGLGRLRDMPFVRRR